MMINCPFSAVCVDNVSAKLGEIEKSYYGYKYSDSAETRLERLEKNVYGTPNPTPKLSQSARAQKLYKDLAIDEKSSPKIAAESAAANTRGYSNTSTGAAADFSEDIGPKAEAGIKYPVVDKLEEKVFGKTFENDDIYARLSKLEKQTFPNQKKESTHSLSERVDALRDKILGGTRTADVDINPSREEIILNNGQKYYGDYVENSNSFENEDNPHYNYYSYENSKNRISQTQSSYDDNFSRKFEGNNVQNYGQIYDLDILEQSLLGKKYSSEAPSKRLARLESKVFSRTFNDDEEARVQRLLAVTTAQKTSQEYDSNKWARRLNAGIQIGSILLMVLAMIL